MKKILAVVLVVVLMAVMLCACGEETYRCGWCQNQVTQKPRIATVFGQECQVCDDCAEGLEAMGADIK